MTYTNLRIGEPISRACLMGRYFHSSWVDTAPRTYCHLRRLQTELPTNRAARPRHGPATSILELKAVVRLSAPWVPISLYWMVRDHRCRGLFLSGCYGPIYRLASVSRSLSRPPPSSKRLPRSGPRSARSELTGVRSGRLGYSRRRGRSALLPHVASATGNSRSKPFIVGNSLRTPEKHINCVGSLTVR